MYRIKMETKSLTETKSSLKALKDILMQDLLFPLRFSKVTSAFSIREPI